MRRSCLELLARLSLGVVAAGCAERASAPNGTNGPGEGMPMGPGNPGSGMQACSPADPVATP
ncbi:MAG TPA: hypothetical protein VGF45_02765, partial [Polyangia bacterium]